MSSGPYPVERTHLHSWRLSVVLPSGPGEMTDFLVDPDADFWNPVEGEKDLDLARDGWF